MLPEEKKAEWLDAQRDWPGALYHSGKIADLDDCAQLRREIRFWLAQPIPDETREFLRVFQQRVVIHEGDLKSDTFKCTLGECG